MAYDSFLLLDGIKGESTDAKHKNEIDILSFSFGAVQSTHASGGGGGAGKVSVQDLTITKKTDSASPLLFLNCCQGSHIKTATLTVRKAGGTQLEYLKIKLTDLLVNKYEDKGSGVYTGTGEGAAQTSDEVPTESVSLNFSKIEITYQPQGQDGKASGGPILAGWDIKANQKV
jgi:type VI secretion system secreted protein Hcp